MLLQLLSSTLCQNFWKGATETIEHVTLRDSTIDVSYCIDKLMKNEIDSFNETLTTLDLESLLEIMIELLDPNSLIMKYFVHHVSSARDDVNLGLVLRQLSVWLGKTPDNKELAEFLVSHPSLLFEKLKSLKEMPPDELAHLRNDPDYMAEVVLSWGRTHPTYFTFEA
jgi:hypothetical protein